MSTILNRMYKEGPRILLSLPLDVSDAIAYAMTFQDLGGSTIRNDGNIEESDNQADTRAPFGSALDPRRNVQVMQRVTPTHSYRPGGPSVQHTPGLPPNVVLADINVPPSGAWDIRGLDETEGRVAQFAVRDAALIGFDAHMSASASWIREGTDSAFRAYYLPWKKNHSRVLKLGQDADFFFTSALTGCTIEVYGNPVAPTVTHTNGGSIPGEEESQRYMHDLLELFRGTAGSWEISTTNDTTLARRDYKAKAERSIDRTRAKLEARGGEIPELRSKTVAVGFRDQQSGEWTFHFQTWIKAHYVWNEPQGRGFVRREKKVIRIKQVGEIWPTFRVTASSWKDADLAGA